jgi:hypothetical protein
MLRQSVFGRLAEYEDVNDAQRKQTLGGITKKGNRYIRKLLVLSATSLLRSVSKRKGALADWISALLTKKPARLVTVALANKLARIIWAIMRTGEIFRAEIFARKDAALPASTSIEQLHRSQFEVWQAH